MCVCAKCELCSSWVTVTAVETVAVAGTVTVAISGGGGEAGVMTFACMSVFSVRGD